MAIGQIMHRSRDAKLQGRVCCASHVTGSLTSDLLPHIEETVFYKNDTQVLSDKEGWTYMLFITMTCFLIQKHEERW